MAGRSSLDAFYLPASPGQRFCVLRAPVAGPVRGAVLHVHAFAEELNKTRRMVALQAVALAEAGFAVLQVDLHGCGDSSGDSGDAAWDGWVDDIAHAARWLAARHPGPLWFWGLRAGALLAVQAAARLATPVDFLFWQPFASGRQQLQQFLRLKAVGDMLAGRQKGVMDEMKAALARGESVEIAGHALSASVAAGLEQATLELPANTVRVVWLEVASQPGPTLSPVAERTLAAWRERGIAVDARVVAGPAFWQTTEIETAPALLDAGVATLAMHAEAVTA